MNESDGHIVLVRLNHHMDHKTKIKIDRKNDLYFTCKFHCQLNISYANIYRR